MSDKLFIYSIIGTLKCKDLLLNNQNEWQNSINNFSYVPYEYTISAIKYYFEYIKPFYDFVIDISHVIRMNTSIIGLWTLQVRKKNGTWSIGSNYSGILQPIFNIETSDKTKRKVLEDCADFLIYISLQLGIKQLDFRIQSFKDGADYWHTIWMNRGSRILNVDHICYVDLTLTVSQIQKKIRRRYIDYIHESQRLWDTKIIDYYDMYMFNQYKELHHLIAGRITRGDATWREQCNALANNEAFLIFVADKQNTIIGSAYFLCSKDECYYLSGAFNRELFPKPVSHIVQYLAIFYCKKRGLNYYKLGERYYKGDLNLHSSKEYSISYFKEGFASNIFLLVNLRFQNA